MQVSVPVHIPLSSCLILQSNRQLLLLSEVVMVDSIEQMVVTNSVIPEMMIQPRQMKLKMMIYWLKFGVSLLSFHSWHLLVWKVV